MDHPPLVGVISNPIVTYVPYGQLTPLRAPAPCTKPRTNVGTGVTDASSDPTTDDDRRRRKAIVAAFVVAALVIAGVVVGFVLLRPGEAGTTAAPVQPTSTPVPPTVEPVDVVERSEKSSTAAASTSPPTDEPLLLGIAGPVDAATGTMSGSIVSSPDGVNWSTDFTPSTAIRALAAGSETVIAVGETVAITADGESWTELKGGPTGARGIAYGDGKWIAVGDPAQPPSGRTVDNTFRFVAWTTTDGRTWQREEHTADLPDGGRMSVFGIAFGNDGWVVSGVAELGDSFVQVLGVSKDGTSWVDSGAEEFTPVGAVSWNGESWGRIGGRLNYFQTPPTSTLVASSSVDLRSWTRVDATPTGAVLDNLTCSGDRGWLAVGSDAPLTAGERPADLYRSADLVAWTKVGRPEVGGLADVVAYRDKKTPSAKVCAVGNGPADPSPGTDPNNCTFELGKFGTGPAWLDVPDGATGCPEALRTWQQYESWTGPTEGQLLFATLPDGALCNFSNFPPSEAGRQLDDGSIGRCELTDGRSFVVWRGETGQKITQDGRNLGTAEPGAAAAPGAPSTPTSASTARAASGGTVTGDLGLSVPMTRPACDGTGIVVLFSAVDPAVYAAEVQEALDANPGAAYLRTDQSCASLTQATEAGDPIYAVYRVGGTLQSEVCAAVTAAGNGAYGKWLKDSGDAAARIDC